MDRAGASEVLGQESNAGQKVTRITFTDRSTLVVWWDGRYGVAGADGARNAVSVDCPNGRLLIFPWHRIDLIEHNDPESGYK